MSNIKTSLNHVLNAVDSAAIEHVAFLKYLGDWEKTAIRDSDLLVTYTMDHIKKTDEIWNSISSDGKVTFGKSTPHHDRIIFNCLVCDVAQLMISNTVLKSGV